MINWRLIFVIQKDYAKNGASADLKITKKCVNRLREIASIGEHLRIMVDGGGCSGFEYKMSLDNKINENDFVFCKDQIKVIVDEVWFWILKGFQVFSKNSKKNGVLVLLRRIECDSGCS